MYYDNLTKYGKFMYDLCFKWAKFLLNHKALYYIMACTWGILMTSIGFLLTILFSIVGIMPVHYYWIYYMMIGENWGGLEMGLMFFTCKDTNEELMEHEFGHTFQNTLLGPLFPLLVGLPSAVRYWIIEIKYRKCKPTPDYNAIWFEASASDIGKYIVESVEGGKNEK